MGTQTQEALWAGTISKCNLCPQKLGDVANGRAMYDVRLPTYGSWANVCYSCYDKHGCRLGTGNGQRYEFRAADGRWVKTGG